MFAEHLSGRESCAGTLFLVCLLIIPTSEHSQLPKRWPDLNGQTGLKAFHGSIQTRLPNLPVTIVTAHGSLLFHCSDIHIVTCSDGSIKRGSARSQICQVSFQIRRHGPAFALHVTFKIKSAKGLLNPDLFAYYLCLCACLVFCHVFLITKHGGRATPLVTFSYRLQEGALTCHSAPIHLNRLD